MKLALGRAWHARWCGPDCWREVIFQDAKERVKELAVQVSGTEAKFTTLEHLDCEGPGFNELWKVLRYLVMFELPSDSLRPLRQLRGWTDESSRADLGDAGIPAMSLTLKALAVMMHDECLNSAFQHVVEGRNPDESKGLLIL
ncbi:unnamed protein product [Durusdinium trenchii]|uniref:Queuosine salvage protein n=1 Tax=Durusdinium trenchii TaxID=1381693 RepID=A0ABP0KWG5_9DINO